MRVDVLFGVQQITPQDTVYAEFLFKDLSSGDTSQRYDPLNTDRSLRLTESQLPNIIAGYHHEWSPGVHTLFVVGRLHDEFGLQRTNE